jgi:hypothetical protein
MTDRVLTALISPRRLIYQQKTQIPATNFADASGRGKEAASIHQAGIKCD